MIDENFIGPDGEERINRTPARVIIYAKTPGTTLSSAQWAGVKSAYRRYCTSKKRVDLGDGSLSWYTRLTDGTLVRCVTQREIDAVYVWPEEHGGEEFYSGIGIAFTDIEGVPVEGWKRVVDEVEEPQPLVLSPIPRKTPTGYESTGQWRVQKVPKLIGGNKLWTRTDRKYWFSIFSAPNIQEAFSSRVRTQPTTKRQYHRETWTASADDRLLLAFASPPYTGYGKYIMAGNDTVRLMPNHSTFPPFATTTNHHGTRMHHVTLATTLATITYDTAKPQKGLAAEGADLTDAYMDAGTVEIEPPTGYRFQTGTFSAHPSGLQFLCRATVYPYDPAAALDYVAVFTLNAADEFEVAVSSLGTNNSDKTYTGSVTHVIYTEVWPRYTLNYRSPTNCMGEGSVAAAVEAEGDNTYQTITSPLTTMSFTSDTYQLDRVYYDRAGTLIADKLGNSYSLTYEHAFSSQTDNYVNYVSNTSGSTDDSNRTSNWVLNASSYYELKGTRFFVEELVCELDETAQQWYTYAFNGTFDTVSETKTVTSSGFLNHTDRTILFFDEQHNFILYIENYRRFTLDDTETVTETVVDSPRLQWPGQGGNMELETSTSRIVATLNGIEVFSYALPTRHYTPKHHLDSLFTYAYPFQLDDPFALSSLSLPGASNTTETDYGTFEVAAAASEPCGDKPPGYDGVWVGSKWVGLDGVYWTYDKITQTIVRVPDLEYDVPGSLLPPLTSVLNTTLSPKRPEQYCHIEYAKDPITHASIINFTFRGEDYDASLENESWIWAIDNTGLKNLSDIITLPPSVKPMVWETYNLNCLVSI